jgi:hypothetical protein
VTLPQHLPDAAAGRSPTGANRGRRWPDAAALLILSAIVLPLYLTTLYPDIVENGDSAKFQFLGSVLGTPHAPGYPLYVLVSYAFSFVPLGTLAWRMNLLSALAGLLTVLFTYAAARRLGAGVLQSLLLGLALSTGLVFWSESLVAEVYTLGALLLMSATWRVIAWRETRLDRDLFVAIATLSVGLGNHLTIAAVAPAFVAYVLLTDARRALRPRVLTGLVVMVIIGVSQYGFILLRTWQQTPYLEARAATLTELIAVVSAEKYQNQMFHFGWHMLLTERLPLLGSQLLAELQPTGAFLVLVGFFSGLWQAPREALLLACSAAGILALTLNVEADTAGFATAALPPLWLLAALVPGMSGALRPSPRAVLTTLASAALATTVIAGAWGNFRSADHSDRTLERRLWTAVFEAVPDRSVVVTESYSHDQGLRYMLIGERIGQSRGIELVSRDVADLDRAFRDERRTVVAFDAAVRDLTRMGFEFRPLPLLDWSIPRLVGSSRRDEYVVAAIQPEATLLLAAESPELMKRFGGTWTPERNPRRYALVGTPRSDGGAPRSARGAVEAQDSREVGLHVSRGRTVGRSATLPRDVDVRVAAGEIVISVEGEQPFRTKSPMAVLVLGKRGEIRQRLVPASPATLRPSLDVIPAYTLAVSVSCEDVGDRQWHDVSRIAAQEMLVRVNNYEAFDAHAVLYAAAGSPLAPRIVQTHGPNPARISVEAVPPAGRIGRFSGDRLQAPALLREPNVVRIQLDVNDGGDEATTVIDLGGQPSAVWTTGTADRVAAPRVRACRRTTLPAPPSGGGPP